MRKRSEQWIGKQRWGLRAEAIKALQGGGVQVDEVREGSEENGGEEEEEEGKEEEEEEEGEEEEGYKEGEDDSEDGYSEGDRDLEMTSVSREE